MDSYHWTSRVHAKRIFFFRPASRSAEKTLCCRLLERKRGRSSIRRLDILRTCNVYNGGDKLRYIRFNLYRLARDARA